MLALQDLWRNSFKNRVQICRFLCLSSYQFLPVISCSKVWVGITGFDLHLSVVILGLKVIKSAGSLVLAKFILIIKAYSPSRVANAYK